jgi:hypothetical protein
MITKKRAFISFDIDHDEYVKKMLVGQAKFPAVILNNPHYTSCNTAHIITPLCNTDQVITNFAFRDRVFSFSQLLCLFFWEKQIIYILRNSRFPVRSVFVINEEVYCVMY